MIGQRTIRIFILCFALVAGGAHAAEIPYGSTGDSFLDVGPAAGARSVETKVTFFEAGDGGSVAALGEPRSVILAALAEEPGAPPQALAVVWVKEDGGWFGPAWELRLQSSLGLLPPGATIPAPPNPAYVALPAQPPRPGHTYHTWLSYDPEAGAVSIRVYDLTAGSLVHAGSYAVPERERPLFAGASPLAGEIRAYPFFVPRVVGWGLVEVTGDERRPAPLLPLDRRLPLALALRVPASSPGTFHLYVEQGEGRARVATVDASRAGEALVPVAAGAFPLGSARLVLEYRFDGRVLFSEAREIVTGRVALSVERVAPAREEGLAMLRGFVRVEADGPFPAFPIDLEYEVAVPQRIAPLHEEWRTLTGTVRLSVESFEEGETLVPFALPLESLEPLESLALFAPAGPDDTRDAPGPPRGTGAPNGRREAALGGGVLYGAFQARADTGVESVASAVVRLAFGARTPPFPKVGPYTVLRGDFHVHTSESHDSTVSPEYRVWESYRYGYDVVAFTDHGSTSAYDRSAAFAEELGLILIRGLETGLDAGSTGEHLTVLGVDAAYAPRHAHSLSREPGRSRTFYQDEARAISDHGGLMVYAHPGWPGGRLATDAVSWLVEHGRLQGVEVRGPQERLDWAFRFALEHGLAVIEGSDVHESRDFDTAAEAPVTLILAGDESAAGVVEAIREGRTLAWRGGVLRGSEKWLAPLVDAMIDISLVERDGERCALIANGGPLPLRGVVTVHERGAGADGSGGVHRISVGPGERRCLPSPAPAATLEIWWENVYAGPGRLFRTEHAL